MSKRHKSDPKINDISSYFFADQQDEEQFKSIFTSIASSELTKNCNVIKAIVREIACFATGNFKYCENAECKQEINVLFGDEKKDPNSLEYVYYNIMDAELATADYTGYFCQECMGDAIEVKCGKCHSDTLVHYPTSTECVYCQEIFTKNCCGGDICDCVYCEGDCDWHKACALTMPCVICRNITCLEHRKLADPYLDYVVCDDCCNAESFKINIKCYECKENYELLHSRLKFAFVDVYNVNGNEKCIKQCNFVDCQEWICCCNTNARKNEPFYCKKHDHHAYVWHMT